jgi:hypothetical protein
LQSGEPLLFQASSEEFRRGGGAVVVSIRDAESDTMELRLEVINWGRPMTGGRQRGPLMKAPAGGSQREPEEVARPAELVEKFQSISQLGR